MTPGRGCPPHILKNNMDATELMIGDWVGRVFDDKRIDYRQVDWIRTGEIGMRYQKVWAIGCIEPIPLTPEILEKNGFIKVNSQRYDYGYPDTDCYVKVNPKKNMIHVNGRNANSNLYSHSFVHELQQALRLCGLNEIADNFKV